MEVTGLSHSEMDVLLKSQKKTALEWRNSSAKSRIERLKKLREWIQTNQLAIQKAVWEDFKKPADETDLSEIYPVTSEINHAIKNLKSWMKPRKISNSLSMFGTSGYIQSEPKGCALILAPWNYPFNLTIGPLVSALAAGCPAIIKPSEMTPNTSFLLARMVKEIFKKEEVSVILGDHEIAQRLLELPFDHIFFTGSTAVGKIVMEKAAKNLSSVTLELGGKSPAIITSTADIKDAAKKLVYGKFVNCGQTCIAPDYILVKNEVKTHLQSEIILALKEMYDPEFKGFENSPDLARIVNLRHFDRLHSLLINAMENGAKIEFGGKSYQDSLFIEPTILSGISEEMNISKEEIFGPLLPIIPFNEIREAIDFVNSKPKPLALYVFDKSKESDMVLKSTSSGNAVVNDCVLHFLHLNLPFGGVNASGMGKSHGYFGFLAFSNEKGILKQRIGLNNVTLLRPPYGVRTKQIIKSLIKWF